MKNELQNFLEEENEDLVEKTVTKLDVMNASIEKIVSEISDFTETTRIIMYMNAHERGKKKLAAKIEQATEIINLRRIDDFKQAVANGTYKTFLACLPWTEKISLEAEMGLLKFEAVGDMPLTQEEQVYFDIIETSIQEEITKEALNQGIASIEGSQDNNLKILENTSSN